eukprot:3933879-Rhodomonas_salina.1
MREVEFKSHVEDVATQLSELSSAYGDRGAALDKALGDVRESEQARAKISSELQEAMRAVKAMHLAICKEATKTPATQGPDRSFQPETAPASTDSRKQAASTTTPTIIAAGAPAAAVVLGGVGIGLGPASVKGKGGRQVQVVKVTSLAPGGAAASCGEVKVEDLVLEVDGKGAVGMSMKEVVMLIKGPVGSVVKVKGKHGVGGGAYEVKLVRGGGAQAPMASASVELEPESTKAPEQARLLGEEGKQEERIVDIVGVDAEIRAEELGKEGCEVARVLREGMEQLQQEMATLQDSERLLLSPDAFAALLGSPACASWC